LAGEALASSNPNAARKIRKNLEARANEALARFRSETYMIGPKITAGLLAVAGLALFAPGHAAAQSAPGLYAAVGVAYDDMPDRNLNISGHTVSSQWRSGWGGLAAAGYKWSSGLRTELELSGRIAKVTAFNGVNPWAGSQYDNSLMLNVLYDFNLGGPIAPFVGVGLGATELQWADNFRATAQATPFVYDGEGMRAGWQGIAGVSYAVTPKIALALDARIKGAFADFSFPGSVPGRDITRFNYQTRSVFASVRYSFGPGLH
jgi:opacity protein-like surface antigen